MGGSATARARVAAPPQQHGECPLCSIHMPVSLLPSHVELCMLRGESTPRPPSSEESKAPECSGQGGDAAVAGLPHTLPAPAPGPAPASDQHPGSAPSQVGSFFQASFSRGIDWSKIGGGGRAEQPRRDAPQVHIEERMTLCTTATPAKTPPVQFSLACERVTLTSPPSALAMMPGEVRVNYGTATLKDKSRKAFHEVSTVTLIERLIASPLPVAADLSSLDDPGNAALGETGAVARVGLLALGGTPPGAAAVEGPSLENPNAPPVRGGITLPILKSALQKSIRRCAAAEAVRCALAIIKMGEWGELLRRVPIIMLEDAVLHPSLPVIVYLMCVDSQPKNRDRVRDCHINLVLTVVYDLASCGVKDQLSEDDHQLDGPGEDADGVREHAQDGDLSDGGGGGGAGEGVGKRGTRRGGDLGVEEEVLCRSIRARASYGGSNWDINMLQGYERMWRARFSGASSPAPGGGPWLAYLHRLYGGGGVWIKWAKETLPLDVHDIPKSAIDFHCIPTLLPDIEQKYDKEMSELRARLGMTSSEDLQPVLRDLMWAYRSGVSNKGSLNGSTATVEPPLRVPQLTALKRPEVTAIYNKLAPLFDRHSSSIILWRLRQQQSQEII